ncbi:MAG: prepilin peptidase [Sphingomonadales bacterium]|jgi:prepilin peptidase CpaA|nr:prepilin peptidase [Sphingomonadales bacterium]MBK9004078.1 prepilin peptidase [Sphingomonadales bacterium]MBK9269253.1 prepilin peptidase [Sphingomonadales bacterium]MBP6434088.1 prepilin peptidase [Sphingorhabdus sp.]
MDQDFFAYALLGGLAIGLLVSIYSDIRYRLIYNWVTGPIALAAPLYWLATGTFGWPEIGYYLAAGTATFLFFALFFQLGMMGGGDVKLFGAVALWFHPLVTIKFVFNASLLGALVTIIFFVVHKIQKGSGQARVPYGVAISIAGLWCAGEQFFNHFG